MGNSQCICIPCQGSVLEERVPLDTPKDSEHDEVQETKNGIAESTLLASDDTAEVDVVVVSPNADLPEKADSSAIPAEAAKINVASIEPVACLEEEPAPRPVLSEEDEAVMAELSRKAGDGHLACTWIHQGATGWLALQRGDSGNGHQLIELASKFSNVYPWVFQVSFAVNHLSKDLKEQIAEARKYWPKGAVTLRQAVRMEVEKEGIAAIEKKYWNTCTVRLIWIYRAIRILQIVLEDLGSSNRSPIESAQRAVQIVLKDTLNSALKRIADFIISLCVYKKREKIFSVLKLKEEEARKQFQLFCTILTPHADYLEAMFMEEVPSVVKLKPP